MTIAELLQNLPIRLGHGTPDTIVTDIVEDSRLAHPGCLFVARPGGRADGRRFINDAISAGAVAVLTDLQTTVPSSVVALRADDIATASAQIAERLFGNPSRSLTLIGVTGTNGKTTIAHLVHQLLTTAGRACGMIGTVCINDGASSQPAALTTPSAIDTSRLLRRMVDNGCDACVMEVSSHALQQGRASALEFDIAVFTNLTGDHLDYHGTMDNYAAAKAILFTLLDDHGHAIVNSDDDRWTTMVRNCRASVHRCSLTANSVECTATIRQSTVHGSSATLRIDGNTFDAHIPLIGRHNVMNALQAIAAAHTSGADIELLRPAIEHITPPPGRFERVDAGDTGITILVDYAHTDDALDNALSALRSLVPADARLHVVFGCGGDRDQSKRPRMAAAACRWADVVHITSDNPRTEDPQVIIEQIIAGMPDDYCGRWRADVDRQRAIEVALREADQGDVVLIAGKGHEDYQIIGEVKRPFDDRLVASRAVAALQEVPA